MAMRRTAREKERLKRKDKREKAKGEGKRRKAFHEGWESAVHCVQALLAHAQENALKTGRQEAAEYIFNVISPPIAGLRKGDIPLNDDRTFFSWADSVLRPSEARK